MSHFSVLIVHDKDAELAELMAPYQENNMGDCPREFMEFNDVEDEYRKEYAEDGKTEWYPKKSLYIRATDENPNPNLENALRELLKGNNVTVNVEDMFGMDLTCDGKIRVGRLDENNDDVETAYGSILTVSETLESRVYAVELTPCDAPKQILFKDAYADFETFMEEWAGHEGVDEETGRYGYWENPNRKWDWWEVGGRWAGQLRLKESVDATKYPTLNFSWGWSPEEQAKALTEHRTDTAMACDVKWEGMLPQEDVDYNKRFWEVNIEEDPNATKEEKEKYRTFYNNEYYLGRYKTKENYLKVMDSFSTFAVLNEDGWHEQGEMGWFGCSSASSEDENEWDKEFYEQFIKDLPEDKMVTVVDCHI